jgi:hypothetical protein
MTPTPFNGANVESIEVAATVTSSMRSRPGIRGKRPILSPASLAGDYRPPITVNEVA